MQLIIAIISILLCIFGLYLLLTEGDSLILRVISITIVLSIIFISSFKVLKIVFFSNDKETIVTVEPTKIDLAVSYFDNAECIEGKLKTVRIVGATKFSGAYLIDESGNIKQCQSPNQICYNGFVYEVDNQGFPSKNVFDKDNGYKRCGAESELK